MIGEGKEGRWKQGKTEGKGASAFYLKMYKPP